MQGKSVLAELLLARIALRLSDTTLAKQLCDAALKRSFQPRVPYSPLSSRVVKWAKLSELWATSMPHIRRMDARERSVERLRGSLRGEELKIAFFENKLEVYENLVDLCLRRSNSSDEAFGYIEQAKSRSPDGPDESSRARARLLATPDRANSCVPSGTFGKN